MEQAGRHVLPIVRNVLEKELASFLREKRGRQTFAQFSKKIGLRQSTLHRLEQCQQSLTLKNLHLIMERTNSTLADIFPDRCKR